MHHRFDMHKVDKKAIQDMERARKWHEAINEKIEKNGGKPFSLMNDAIKNAKKNHLIGEKTVNQAHVIRKKGNNARHKF